MPDWYGCLTAKAASDNLSHTSCGDDVIDQDEHIKLIYSVDEELLREKRDVGEILFVQLAIVADTIEVLC